MENPYHGPIHVHLRLRRGAGLGMTRGGPIAGLIRFVLEQRLVVGIAAALVVLGVAVAPFDWDLDWLPRDPVAVDAIPDLGENQQIVFTDWGPLAP
jgi:copper/silver efflux system protein